MNIAYNQKPYLGYLREQLIIVFLVFYVKSSKKFINIWK